MIQLPFRTFCLALFMGLVVTSGIFYFPESAYAKAEYTDFYFVRHAQTRANATHKYTKKNEKTISSKGRKQIKRLVRKLDKYHGPFDEIIVSPTVRTRETALAYLKEAPYRTAEIWPEVSECCWQKEDDGIQPNYRNRGHIGLRKEHRAYFHFRSMAKNDMSWHSVDSLVDGKRQIASALDILKARYSHSGKKIIIFTHYYAGLRMMNALLGDEYKELHVFKNAKVSLIRQHKDGRFELVLFNNHPPKKKLKKK